MFFLYLMDSFMRHLYLLFSSVVLVYLLLHICLHVAVHLNIPLQFSSNKIGSNAHFLPVFRGPAVKKLTIFLLFVCPTASCGKERPRCCECGPYAEEDRLKVRDTYKWIGAAFQHHECLPSGNNYNRIWNICIWNIF